MKAFFQFLRTTISGGILFLLPLVLLYTVFNKAHSILLKVSAPLASKLPDHIFGWDGSSILALILLVIICFVSGLLFRSARLQKGVNKIEENILVYIPGYSLLRSIAADTMGEKNDNSLKPVLVRDGEARKIGFLVEEKDGLSTVFVADAPRHDAGEVIIVPTEMVQHLSIPSNKVVQSLKNYGKGAIDWTKGN